MKQNLIWILFGVLFGAALLTFQSCSNSDDEIALSGQDYFSNKEIQDLKDWLNTQRDLDNGELDLSSFPEIKLEPIASNTDKQIIEEYFNRVLYLNDATINGIELNFSYDDLIEKVKNDDLVDENGKSLILSGIQLSKEVSISDEAIDLYYRDAIDDSIIDSRVACDCDNIYNAYITYLMMCQAYGNTWGHCNRASIYFSQYNACRNKENHCPNGFGYDGANCHSGIYIPSGYNGFIYGNGFYTQQNCNISTANNCCPNGFGYDGANCHYWGVYFPSDYEPFIYGNAFYVKPNCY